MNIGSAARSAGPVRLAPAASFPLHRVDPDKRDVGICFPLRRPGGGGNPISPRPHVHVDLTPFPFVRICRIPALQHGDHFAARPIPHWCPGCALAHRPLHHPHHVPAHTAAARRHQCHIASGHPRDDSHSRPHNSGGERSGNCYRHSRCPGG